MSSEIVLIIAVVAMAAALVAVMLKRSPAPSGSPVVAAIDPEALLAPVREQIGVITERINKLSTDTATARVDFNNKLQQAIEESRRVFEQGVGLQDTTTRISTALQGTGQRGSWGQVQLKNVVTLAGLTEHVTFKEQVTTYNEDGERRMPDMVIDLADKRKIIVDSKAPDLNFDGEESTTAADLKRAINELSNKNYPALIEGSMDFVVLFVPSEGVLATALTEDPNLSEFCFTKKVLLATPMTLLSLLRAVEYGWQQLSQIENVKIILEESLELSKRAEKVLEHFSSVGESLAAALGFYNAAVGSVNSRLIPKIRDLRNLGVRTPAEPAELVEYDTHVEQLRKMPPTNG
jgi:DNA recombination protein RmuC